MAEQRFGSDEELKKYLETLSADEAREFLQDYSEIQDFDTYKLDYTTTSAHADSEYKKKLDSIENKTDVFDVSLVDSVRAIEKTTGKKFRRNSDSTPRYHHMRLHQEAVLVQKSVSGENMKAGCIFTINKYVTDDVGFGGQQQGFDEVISIADTTGTSPVGQLINYSGTGGSNFLSIRWSSPVGAALYDCKKVTVTWLSGFSKEFELCSSVQEQQIGSLSFRDNPYYASEDMDSPYHQFTLYPCGTKKFHPDAPPSTPHRLQYPFFHRDTYYCHIASPGIQFFYKSQPGGALITDPVPGSGVGWQHQVNNSEWLTRYQKQGSSLPINLSPFPSSSKALNIYGSQAHSMNWGAFSPHGSYNGEQILRLINTCFHQNNQVGPKWHSLTSTYGGYTTNTFPTLTNYRLILTAVEDGHWLGLYPPQSLTGFSRPYYTPPGVGYSPVHYNLGSWIDYSSNASGDRVGELECWDTGGGAAGGDSLFTSIQQVRVNQSTMQGNKDSCWFSEGLIYADNLQCVAADPGVTYKVCLDQSAPEYYFDTCLDCLGNAIPLLECDGTINATFIDGFCCTDCKLEVSTLSSDCASFGVSDGYVIWDARQASGSWNSTSGNPNGTDGLYTVTVTANNGTSITTQAPAAGAKVQVSGCVTNTTSGTKDQVTVPSNSQIVGGMQVSGTGIPTSPNPTYVKMTGQTGVWNTNVTMFRLETWDNTGGTWISVDATAAGTVVLDFSTGFRGIFGGLLPNNTGGLGASTYYILTITDEDECEETRYFTICEDPGITGCMTATAINYDAGANYPCNSCCITCNDVTGQLSDPTNNYSGDLYTSGSVSTQNVTHSSGTVQTDGVFDISVAMQTTAAGFLEADSTESYTFTLLPLTVQGDINSAGAATATATGILVTSFSSTPSHQFTGLAYGHYAVKVQFVDSSAGTQGLEPCYSYFFGTIKVPVCDDVAATNYNTSIDASLIYADNLGLCVYPVACCTLDAILEDTSYKGTQCAPFLYSAIQCDPAATGITGYWELDGIQITNSGFVLGTQSTTSTTIWLQDTNGNSLFNLTGNYTVYIEATYATTPTCNTSVSASFTLLVCGCMDSNAYNYNPLATLQPEGSCIAQSWDCNQNYTCSDPGTGNGYYSTQSGCVGACVVPVPGCMDQCATNYDVGATYNDGTCLYTACLESGASNEYWNCCTGSYKYSATQNDYACCTFPCLTPNTVTSVSTNSAGSCTTPIADGNVVISVVLNTAASTWTVAYYDNTNTTHIFTDLTAYAGGATSNSYTAQSGNGLVPGNYYARVTDSLGCVENHLFTIGTTSLTQGCIDPTAENYDANAVCDDGSCVFCGCMNIYATNYNPNAVCDDGSCIYIIPENPCVPPNIDDRILEVDACLSEKGAEWLYKYKIGTADDCTIMNKWKLILIQYLFKQKGLTCLYNCADADSPNITSITSCGLLAAVGGPNTGYNDQGYAGSSVSVSAGTQITNPASYFVLGNTLHYGDVITMPSGLVWKMVQSGSCTYGCYNPESNQGSTSGNWVQCVNENTITVPNNINYIDNFLNFANKYCRDCKIMDKYLLQSSSGSIQQI